MLLELARSVDVDVRRLVCCIKWLPLESLPQVADKVDEMLDVF